MELTLNKTKRYVISSRELVREIYGQGMFLHKDHKMKILLTLRLENALCRKIC